jgi:hypothetical protein
MRQERHAIMLHCLRSLMQLLDDSCIARAAVFNKDNVAAACSLTCLGNIFLIIQLCNVPNIFPTTKARTCTTTAAAATTQAHQLLLLLLLFSSSSSRGWIGSNSWCWRCCRLPSQQLTMHSLVSQCQLL